MGVIANGTADGETVSSRLETAVGNLNVQCDGYDDNSGSDTTEASIYVNHHRVVRIGQPKFPGLRQRPERLLMSRMSKSGLKHAAGQETRLAGCLSDAEV